MKKTVFTALICVFVLGLSAGAMAYTFDDTTLVQPWKNGAPTGDPFIDVLGSASTFDTFGADLVGNTFTIHTNWNPNKNGTISALVTTADLFFDKGNDGSWDIAVRLDTLTGTGNVYDASSFSNADLIFSGTGLTYGGLYDETALKDTAVLATGALLGTTSVVWTIPGTGLNNQVAVDLSGLGLVGSYSFFWGTATCANDGFSAVPVPASMVLLGSGLLGLVGLGIRKKDQA